jgi:taurine transport system substrate-binding protein
MGPVCGPCARWRGRLRPKKSRSPISSNGRCRSNTPRSEGTYEEAMGVDINWVSFDTGTAMSAAMASGDVQISVSQGVPPFVVATSAGQDLQILDVAVSYADNDNCVVRRGRSRSTRTNAGNWRARRSACRSAPRRITASSSRWSISASMSRRWKSSTWRRRTAPRRLRRARSTWPAAGAAALRRMKEHGNVLLTGAEKDRAGHPGLRRDLRSGLLGGREPTWWRKFLKVTADMNAMWADEANHGRDAAGDRQGCGHGRGDDAPTISTFQFPTVEEQLSDKWLGGGAQSS